MNQIFSVMIDHSDAYIDYENFGRFLELTADREVSESGKAQRGIPISLYSWKVIQMYKLAAQCWLKSSEMAKADIENNRSEHPDVDRKFAEMNYSSHLECLRKADEIANRVEAEGVT